MNDDQKKNQNQSDDTSMSEDVNQPSGTAGGEAVEEDTKIDEGTESLDDNTSAQS